MRIRSKVGISLACWKTLIISWFIGYLFLNSGCQLRLDDPLWRAMTNERRQKQTSLVEQLHVEPERAHFLHQHVEAFGNARLEIVLAAYDGLIDLGATRHVVRLDGEDFLQRIGGAVGFERPHLHLAETLV